ncbi:ataxin 3 variant ref [Halteromyces radiatus]|uniref:ataxin 3 variant ref n=1 Tax=Halteromyces radiatus TaxID=101107 RepID=UPI002220E7AC|nr:ataxin 3 variant ref [Halteromyces radiatus]KAI8093421.1 ataxin 3 variant ref [Halteromyces radiatus]
MDLIPDIVFEKQEGNLCAQHALNALLQGNYFTAVDLAQLGRELDLKESMVRGHSVSGENYDDSGYFSIQVIQQALSVWDLELIPWASEQAVQARTTPENELAYICHLHQHWFTLRKFAVPWRWYNLNSTQNAPSYLSETYLGLLLQQIQNEGYSIFVVRGILPKCIADEKAAYLPRPSVQEKNKACIPFSGKAYRLTDTVSESETSNGYHDNDDEQRQLAQAIEASLQDSRQQQMDDMRRKRLARFGG